MVRKKRREDDRVFFFSFGFWLSRVGILFKRDREVRRERRREKGREVYLFFFLWFLQRKGGLLVAGTRWFL